MPPNPRLQLAGVACPGSAGGQRAIEVQRRRAFRPELRKGALLQEGFVTGENRLCQRSAEWKLTGRGLRNRGTPCGAPASDPIRELALRVRVTDDDRCARTVLEPGTTREGKGQ